MEEDFLQQLIYSVESGINEIREESRQFRTEASKQNYTMSKFMSDLSNNFFTNQSEYQSDINNSMNEIERQTASTNQNINDLEYILQESISVQSRMLNELKDVSQAIGSLVQLFQQNSGSSQFSFGGLAGGAAGLLGGAALTAGVGVGLNSLISAGTASASEITQSGEIGNQDTGGGDRLSVSQMVDLAKQAGFDENQAAIMGAIAAAESSGDTRAHNPNANTGDNSYGLWQINMLGNMGSERRRQFGIENNEQLWDAATNAKAAKNVFDQQGFDAWSVYKSGAYKQFLGTAQESTGNVEASKDETDGKVVEKSSISNSIGSLDSSGNLNERKGFVIHHTGGRGDVGGVVSTLNQRGLSVQYVIDREGAIHQLMPSGARASHMRKGQGVGAGLSNSNTEGVEIIANDDSDILPIQVEAAKKLASQLGYAPNQVYGHGEINPHKQKTEGATVVSAIRGGAPPANPSESQSATGSTGLTGENGNSAEMQSNPFAGTAFESLTSQISGALSSLTSFGEMGQGMLSGGSMLPNVGGALGIAPMLGNMISSLPGQFLQNNKGSDISSVSNNLGVEKMVSELSNQNYAPKQNQEVISQSRPAEGSYGPPFTPTVGSSTAWVDKLAGKTKFSKSFIMNGIYA